MKIKELKLSNFRIFSEETILSFNKYNSLVGKNGTGKTAVLEAINYCCSKGFSGNRVKEADFNSGDEIKIEIYFDELFIIKIPDGFNTLSVPCNGVALHISRRKISSGKALNDGYTIKHFAIPVRYVDAKELNEQLSRLEVDSNDIPSRISGSNFGYSIARKTSKDKEVDYRLLAFQSNSDLKGFPEVFYFSKERARESKRGFGSLISKISNDLNWRYLKDLDKDNVLSLWEPYYKDTIDKVENKKKRVLIEPLKEKMKLYFGDKFDILELSLVDLEEPFSKSDFTLRKKNELKQINVDGLGSGESMILAYQLLKIVSELSKEEVIFLVDEPELHLHPQAQHKLFQEIKFSNYQFILSTHSDIFVDISEWETIKRFCDLGIFPKEEQLKKNYLGKSLEVHLDEIKKYFHDKSIFLRENNEILFADKCLLVEGPIDKYGLPLLSLKKSINLNNITIIACNGKSKIPYFQLLCLAFNVDNFVVYDTDSDGDDANISAFSSSNIFKFPISFESELGMSPNCSHKFSKALEKIEQIEIDNIPSNIDRCITEIDNWSKNK